MLRSRAGGSIKLVGLLDEAVARAAELARQKNPGLSETAVAEVARAVGIGAIKFADLSTDRIKDYVSDWQRMLSLDGNTAPYLQYAHARLRSIFRRAGIEQLTAASISITHPVEHALALELVNFGTVVTSVEQTLEFHRLAGYLCTPRRHLQRLLRALPGPARRRRGTRQPAGSVRPHRPGPAPRPVPAGHRHPGPHVADRPLGHVCSPDGRSTSGPTPHRVGL